MNSTTFPAQPGGTARSALDLLKLQILYPNLSSEERLSPSQHLPVPAGPSAAMRCPLIRYELMTFTGSAKKVSKQTVPDVALWRRFCCVRPTSAHGCRELPWAHKNSQPWAHKSKNASGDHPYFCCRFVQRPWKLLRHGSLLSLSDCITLSCIFDLALRQRGSSTRFFFWNFTWASRGKSDGELT